MNMRYPLAPQPFIYTMIISVLSVQEDSGWAFEQEPQLWELAQELLLLRGHI